MITRFAPSPTGPLHLGHAFSAMTAFDMAQRAGGRFLLRIEDIDRARAKPKWETAIYDDLHWLGLSWPRPVMRQSERLFAYRAALADLWSRGLIYPCTCSRADIRAALAAPQEGAPVLGPDGLIYPGTCRHRPEPSAPLPQSGALRLNMAEALASLATPMLGWTEDPPGRAAEPDPARLCRTVGDVVLARLGMGTSYHLSVVVDDAAQGVTHVVRGRDLQEATPIHVLLQRLLGLPTPRYHHHRLIRDDTGRRLAKRDDARAISRYRDEGANPSDIRRFVGLMPD